MPAPQGDVEAPTLKPLSLTLFTMPTVGVILQVRVVNGMVKPGDKIQMMSNGRPLILQRLVFYAWAVSRDYLATGMLVMSQPQSRPLWIPHVSVIP